jgi:RNA binding exosome subunit
LINSFANSAVGASQFIGTPIKIVSRFTKNNEKLSYNQDCAATTNYICSDQNTKRYLQKLELIVQKKTSLYIAFSKQH